jgi:RecA-family ATPase
MSPEEREAGKRVRVVPMLGQRFDIMNDECFDALLRACTDKRLLILDTMRRIHTLDENDGGAMAQVVSRLEEIAAATGCAILFLHHTNKAATFNGSGDQQQASRGSSVLVDNIRFQMFMLGLNENDKEQAKEVQKELWSRFVRMGVSKVNYGERIGDVWLYRGDGGILERADFPTSALTSLAAAEYKDAAKAPQKTAKNFNGGNW